MKLSSVFESWHIGDGNYPPLKRNDLVNLAFQLNPITIEISNNSIDRYFEHLTLGEYEYKGIIERVYEEKDENSILYVVNFSGFLAYIELHEKEKKYKLGDVLEGRGILLFDYYVWTEYFAGKPGSPDLYYKFRVENILKVNMPERFIKRHDKGWGAPSMVTSENLTDKNIESIETMEGQPFETEFYVIEMVSEGIEEKIEKTFIW